MVARLYQQFLSAAKMDLDAARVLNNNNGAAALFHLQQSYEKSIKSFHIFNSIEIHGLSSDDAYSKATKYSHKVDESITELLVEITEIEKIRLEKVVNNDPKYNQARNNSILQMDQFITEIKNLPQKLQLDNKLMTHIQNFGSYVESIHTAHSGPNQESITSSPDFIYFSFISLAFSLYPCVYKLESISRYPLKEFQYKNLELLANQDRACVLIIELVSMLIDIIDREFKRFGKT